MATVASGDDRPPASSHFRGGVAALNLEADGITEDVVDGGDPVAGPSLRQGCGEIDNGRSRVVVGGCDDGLPGAVAFSLETRAVQRGGAGDEEEVEFKVRPVGGGDAGAAVEGGHVEGETLDAGGDEFDGHDQVRVSSSVGIDDDTITSRYVVQTLDVDRAAEAVEGDDGTFLPGCRQP